MSIKEILENWHIMVVDGLNEGLVAELQAHEDKVREEAVGKFARYLDGFDGYLADVKFMVERYLGKK